MFPSLPDLEKLSPESLKLIERGLNPTWPHLLKVFVPVAVVVAILSALMAARECNLL